MSDINADLQWSIVIQVIPLDNDNTLVKRFLSKIEEAITFSVDWVFTLFIENTNQKLLGSSEKQ